MEDRYKYTGVKKDAKNKRLFATTFYPVIEKKLSDIYIITKKGDRLDLLANKYYDDTRLWSLIAQANQLGNGTLVVESGIQLRIPMDLSDIETKLRQINEEL